MKNIFTAYLIGIVLLLAFTDNAWSLPYPVSAGDIITMYAQDTSVQNEGYYQFSTSSGSKYGTFCVEVNEYFTPGNQYTVRNIENYAENGGINGQTSLHKDPISDATKWLFWHFMSKDIQAVTGKAENDYSLQLAIWNIEGELVTGNYLTQYNNDVTAKAYYDAAISSGTDGSAYNVMVMNLVDGNGTFAQSQLVGAAPVPEPCTFLLFGAGLGGLGFWRRKTQN